MVLMENECILVQYGIMLAEKVIIVAVAKIFKTLAVNAENNEGCSMSQSITN